MLTRIATLTAFAAMMVTPALADCRDELAKLEQAAVTAQTGAVTNEAGMPVTKHQEQVLKGDQGGASAETTGSVGATTQHQEEVTSADSNKGPSVATKMTEAKNLAAVGDETGCIEKVNELKADMGIN